MAAYPKPCHHQLKVLPILVTGNDGFSYLLFECVLYGCRVNLRLNAEGEIDGKFIIPPAQRSA